MPLVSVIIPIYNVEPFIRRCAESLMKQTLLDVEFIFVDDATPDNSLHVLEDVIRRHPDRKQSIIVVCHDENKGLPTARNTGLSYASGEYIFHCDSDDWLEDNALELLYLSAKAVDADFVYSDFCLNYEDSERYMHTHDFKNISEVLKHGLLGGKLKYNVWNKLVKRSIYLENDIRFPDGHGMGEDMTMIRLCACCKTVAAVHSPVYHYVKMNTSAFTQSFSKKHLADIRYNADMTISFLNERFPGLLDKEICYFKQSLKLPLLIGGNFAQFKIWREWYPEVNNYIFQNTNLPFRTRMLELFASWDCYGLVWIYNQIVYRVLYRLMYK